MQWVGNERILEMTVWNNYLHIWMFSCWSEHKKTCKTRAFVIILTCNFEKKKNKKKTVADNSANWCKMFEFKGQRCLGLRCCFFTTWFKQEILPCFFFFMSSSFSFLSLIPPASYYLYSPAINHWRCSVTFDTVLSVWGDVWGNDTSSEIRRNDSVGYSPQTHPPVPPTQSTGNQTCLMPSSSNVVIKKQNPVRSSLSLHLSPTAQFVFLSPEDVCCGRGANVTLRIPGLRCEHRSLWKKLLVWGWWKTRRKTNM